MYKNKTFILVSLVFLAVLNCSNKKASKKPTFVYLLYLLQDKPSSQIDNKVKEKVTNPPSSPIQMSPLSPSILSTSVTPTKITLNWNKIDNEKTSHYEVSISTDAKKENWKNVGLNLTHSFTNLNPELLYYIKLRVKTKTGIYSQVTNLNQSSNKNFISITTPNYFITSIKAYQSNSFAFSSTTDKITVVNFSPDGNQIITGTDKGNVTIWNASISAGSTFSKIKEFTSSNEIVEATYSPDGKTFTFGAYTPGSNGEIKIYDVEKDFNLIHSNSKAVGSINYSKDSKKVTWNEVGNNGTISTFNTVTKNLENFEVLKQIYSLNYSKDETKLFLHNSDDDKIRTWDIGTNRFTKVTENIALNPSLGKTIFFAKQSKFFTASQSELKVFDLEGNLLKTTTYQAGFVYMATSLEKSDKTNQVLGSFMTMNSSRQLKWEN